ncbi:MAG TPA: ATP-binding protein [Terracidiphilus sp.]
MGILHNRRPHLQALGLPPDAEVIRRARHFALHSGLTLTELGELANLNPNSLRVYMSGHYDKHNGSTDNTLAVRAALKECIDRYELKHDAPGQTTHYATADYEAVRRSMWTALRQGTAFLLDGPPGTQKTYILRRVAEEINGGKEGRAIYCYARVEHSPQSFLMELCTEAGIPNRGTIDQLIRKLRFFLGGQRTVLIVDEAQHLGTSGLEVLRQLLDRAPYFGVALSGSHDLSLRLMAWQMEQWRSRLRRTHILKGLTKAEAEWILTSELGPMSARDIADSIADITVKSVRDKREFNYISARHLFFAIQDALAALAESAPAADPAETLEAIA